MSHSRKGIAVLTSEGVEWTTRRGAERMCQRGIAARINDREVRLIEGDHRISCESQSTAGARLLDMIRQFPIDPSYWDDRAVLKYWPDLANSGVQI